MLILIKKELKLNLKIVISIAKFIQLAWVDGIVEEYM